MQIIGHRSQLNQLRKAAVSGQLANAYLLAGPEGIGKKLVVLEFAMELFCANVAAEFTLPKLSRASSAATYGHACAVCPQCQKILHNTHPDVSIITVLEDKKDISIKQMREMQSTIQMHPLEGKYKIIIIDNAENMSISAANSVLKALEEPPKATHFFLITSRPHILPPTIISRCQKIHFSPLSLPEIIPHIQKETGVDEETAGLLASISCGSLGLALTLPIGTLNDVTASIKKVLARTGPAEIIETAEKWGKSDSNHGAILSVIISIYKDIAVYQASKKAPSFAKLSKDIINIAKTSDTSSVQKKISAIFSAQNDIETTYNKQLMFEQLLFTLQK